MGLHDLGWMQAHLPDDGSVGVADISSGLCCIGSVGAECARLAGSGL